MSDGKLSIREDAARLLELIGMATPGRWSAAKSGGRDCVWLDIVAGEDGTEILHAETMAQPSAVHPSEMAALESETAQHVINLECVAALHNDAPALLRRLIELEESHEHASRITNNA